MKIMVGERKIRRGKNEEMAREKGRLGKVLGILGRGKRKIRQGKMED